MKLLSFLLILNATLAYGSKHRDICIEALSQLSKATIKVQINKSHAAQNIVRAIQLLAKEGIYVGQNLENTKRVKKILTKNGIHYSVTDINRIIANNNGLSTFLAKNFEPLNEIDTNRRLGRPLNYMLYDESFYKVAVKDFGSWWAFLNAINSPKDPEHFIDNFIVRMIVNRLPLTLTEMRKKRAEIEQLSLAYFGTKVPFQQIINLIQRRHSGILKGKEVDLRFHKIGFVERYILLKRIIDQQNNDPLINVKNYLKDTYNLKIDQDEIGFYLRELPKTFHSISTRVVSINLYALLNIPLNKDFIEIYDPVLVKTLKYTYLETLQSSLTRNTAVMIEEFIQQRVNKIQNLGIYSSNELERIKEMETSLYADDIALKRLTTPLKQQKKKKNVKSINFNRQKHLQKVVNERDLSKYSIHENREWILEKLKDLYDLDISLDTLLDHSAKFFTRRIQRLYFSRKIISSTFKKKSFHLFFQSKRVLIQGNPRNKELVQDFLREYLLREPSYQETNFLLKSKSLYLNSAEFKEYLASKDRYFIDGLGDNVQELQKLVKELFNQDITDSVAEETLKVITYPAYSTFIYAYHKAEIIRRIKAKGAPFEDNYQFNRDIAASVLNYVLGFELTSDQRSLDVFMKLINRLFPNDKDKFKRSNYASETAAFIKTQKSFAKRNFELEDPQSNTQFLRDLLSKKYGREVQLLTVIRAAIQLDLDLTNFTFNDDMIQTVQASLEFKTLYSTSRVESIDDETSLASYTISTLETNTDDVDNQISKVLESIQIPANIDQEVVADVLNMIIIHEIYDIEEIAKQINIKNETVEIIFEKLKELYR